MAAGDEYYRYPCDIPSDIIGDQLNGDKYYRFVLYRPSTFEIFEMAFRDQKDSGHMSADGLEAWTRPAVSYFD